MPEELVLVDSDDNPVGAGEKVSCHMRDGRLHRAFTALVFDRKGRLLLARRSKEKMLWPDCWDATFASHPRGSETFESAAERRMPEELGMRCTMEYLFKFEYHVPYGEIGSENEICGTLMGISDDEPDPTSAEISQTLWIIPAELLARVRTAPEEYCPWMLIALYLLPESGTMGSEKREILKMWTGPEIRTALLAGIRKHLQDDRWELKNERR